MPRDHPVIVFGPGATKDCGGPLTNEIFIFATIGPNQAICERNRESRESDPIDNFINTCKLLD